MMSNFSWCGQLFVTAAMAASYCLSSPANAALITLKTVADVEVREQTNIGTTGAGGSLNSRWLNTGANNEVMAFRFDLTGYDRSQLSGATFNLINHRNNSNRTIRAFGVADGATGVDTTPGWDDNTWDEASVIYTTMPGLAGDNNAATQDETGTDLGTFALTSAASLTGTVNTFSNAAITTFLQSHADDIVTILVRSDNSSSGQARMASREAVALDGGSFPGVAGDYAAYLQFNVIPEPSSLALLLIAGCGSVLRRRSV